jgi:hypothetical protein
MLGLSAIDRDVELRQMAIEWCKENGITYRQA